VIGSCIRCITGSPQRVIGQTVPPDGSAGEVSGVPDELDEMREMGETSLMC
jgi:hypothetical protein